MTPRQAYNIIVWLILLPITIGIWSQFLPPCVLGCTAQIQKAVMPKPLPPVKSYTGPCWRDGEPIKGAL